MKIKASEFIAELNKYVGKGYVYGAVGQVCTESLLKKLESMWGVGGTYDAGLSANYYSNNGDYTKGRCAKWLNVWSADCSGLIKYVRNKLSSEWKDVSAQGTYELCTNTGIIGKMPKIPGCTVYMYGSKSKRMDHVGVYVGDGDVIEARGVSYGIVKTKLSKRTWTHWGLLNYIEHDLPNEQGSVVMNPTWPDSGDASSEQPDDWTTLWGGKFKPTHQICKELGIVTQDRVSDYCRRSEAEQIIVTTLRLLVNGTDFIKKTIEKYSEE